MPTEMPYKILCVCLGNICRSPTAEVVLRHFCNTAQVNVEIDSAGTSNYHPNKAPDLRSQQHALKRGYDLSALRARQLQLEDFTQFDLILAMDFENLSQIQALQQQALQHYAVKTLRAKVALMSAQDAAYQDQPLADPYYGGLQGFEQVLDQCESNSRAWVAYLQQQCSAQ